VVPADGDRVLQQIKLMQDFGVTGIFSTTEYLLEVARKMRQLGSCPQELPLQVVFCNMQPSKHDSVRDVQKEYGVPVIEIYGLGDVFGMGVGAECHAKDGLHIQEDCFYPEIIESASGQVLPNGQIGELVLTSLTLEAMPLIRYRTGIRGFLDYSQCSCGRTLVRLKK
jgi:phenylacetate-CoA ligase